MNKTWIIAQREFLTRVRKKTFLLGTILLPLLIVSFYALMIYFSASSDAYNIAVVDEANIFNGTLPAKKGDISFDLVKQDTATLRGRIQKGDYDAYLVVPTGYNIMGSDSLVFTSAKAVGLMTRESIEKKIDQQLIETRFSKFDIPKQRLDSLQRKSKIHYQGLNKTSDGESRAGRSYAVGFISGFLIYLVLFIYGTMVMRGVMEEKVNRIAEVIISSVKPFQLMMGKILGIGAVGLVQFLIWGVLIITLQILLVIFFPGLMEQASSVQGMQPGGMQASQANGAVTALMQNMNQINFPLIIGTFIFYFLGGYLLYSSLFAAVGSAVNEDPQDAQSLLLPITMPIVFAIVIMTKAVNDPNSGLAVFGSLFPLTSPVVMIARVAHGVPEGVPLWQLILSGVLLILGFIGSTWAAAKIYRTGILMYGKKPTWKEMWKWAVRKS
ncbi:MAG: ABC transporter permease [Chitinophagaceae bacterium]|nr:ABC transporter permease [Chitinophagaceae bacterium]